MLSIPVVFPQVVREFFEAFTIYMSKQMPDRVQETLQWIRSQGWADGDCLTASVDETPTGWKAHFFVRVVFVEELGFVATFRFSMVSQRAAPGGCVARKLWKGLPSRPDFTG